MPRVTFEPKFTIGNIITLIFFAGGVIGLYFSLSGDTASASKDIGDLKPAVIDLQTTSATFNTRLTVVESRAETQATKMAEMAKALEELGSAVQGLAVTSATTRTDVGYIRSYIEEIKRDERGSK